MQIKKGFSILEAVVALAILTTIGAGLIALNVQIQSAANSSRFKSIAQAHAQQMLEQVRSKRDASGGVSSLLEGCYPDGDLDPTAKLAQVCQCGDPNKGGAGLNDSTVKNMKGFVQVDVPLSAGEVPVHSVVWWPEKGKNQCLELDALFYDF